MKKLIFVTILLVLIGYSHPINAALFDPVAYWPFIGNANDASGNGYDGTVNGPVLTAGRFGDANEAYSFDGSNDFIAVPEFLSVDIPAITITAWVKPNDLVQDSVIYYKGNLGEMILRTRAGIYECGAKLADQSWHWVGGGVGDTKKFQHIVAIYKKGDGIELWIDGLYAGKTNISNQNLWNGDRASSIGAYHRSDGFFNGTIDEVAIYNRALSPSEIQASFNEKTGGFYVIPSRKGKKAVMYLN